RAVHETARDHWPPAARLVRRLLRAPEGVVDRLAGGPPVVSEGRVLDRRAQAMLRSFSIDVEAELADVERARRLHVRYARLVMPRRSGVLVSDRVAEGRRGPIPVRVYRRLGIVDDRPGITYLHGGSWFKGDLDSSDRTCRILADVTGCVVVSVHYRRPP